MKLYTEEQVVEMIEKSRLTGLTADYLILTTTSIKLPTDKDIEKIALDFAKKYRATTYEISAFIIGAKWIREQILNSCKKDNCCKKPTLMQ